MKSILKKNMFLYVSWRSLVIMMAFQVFFSIQLHAQSKKQDAIFLKNGEVLYGKIITNDSTKGIRFENSCGIKFLDSKEIDSIRPYKGQSSTLNITKGYFNLSSLALLFGEGRDGYVPVPSLTMVNGYQFNEHTFAGIGIGYEYYEWSVMPVFIDAKYMLHSNVVTPFASIKIGYGIPLRKDDVDFNDNIGATYGGILFAPEIGVSIPVGVNDAFLVSVGYHHQQLAYERQSYYDYYYLPINSTKVFTNYNRISMRIAFLFR